MPAISGQTTVASAGTAVALGDQSANAPVTVKALPGNTDTVYIGNHGAEDVTNANGFPLAAGEQITFEFVGNLASLRVDAAVSGEGVAWLILNA